ncbi:MAG: TauD/TfdA family dioxygenase [Flavobacteriales bacterium]|nr:TauD/TfdA family dioxygenase [Flavobacteriales bacterium]MCB0808075.1 TauD/TfdA family dioxygenase [Flavobacteriales bacterium]
MNTFFKTIVWRNDPDFIADLLKALRGIRVVHLTGVDFTVDMETFYTELTDKLGQIIPADEDAMTGSRSKESARWTDIRYDADQATYFRHSATQQPLHTDTAYTSYENDLNFFFCRTRADIGGATTFFDGEELYRILKKYEPELLDKIEHTIVTFDKGRTERKAKPILQMKDGVVWLNWNYFRVSEQNTPAAKTLCDRFHQFLEEKIVKGGLTTPVILAPGECVFFQDNHILHGRNAFFGDRALIKGALNFREAEVSGHQ